MPLWNCGSRRSESRLTGRLVATRSVIAVALIGMLFLSGCVSPAIDQHGYRGKVTHSANELYGIVGAARLAVRLALRGNRTANLTDSVVTDEENDGQSVLTAIRGGATAGC